MNKWEWLEDEYTWECTSCHFKISDISDGLLDDESLEPFDFGLIYCPSCGERLG